MDAHISNTVYCFTRFDHSPFWQYTYIYIYV